MNESPTQQSRVCVELGTRGDTQPVLIRFSSGWVPGGYSSLDSYALRTTAGWVLIDPLEPTPDGTALLRQLIFERPVATILTSDGHERSCYEASLQRLLQEEFDVIAGSHGRPFRDNPKAAVARLIETL
jgi:glyoxylase-like metal-dependent hydrolase (beta-lactamase superfamily II)